VHNIHGVPNGVVFFNVVSVDRFNTCYAAKFSGPGRSIYTAESPLFIPPRPEPLTYEGDGSGQFLP
jgi:hypothetical protein